MAKWLGMCYNKVITHSLSSSLCSICKSPLIQVSRETTTPEGSKFSQTTTVYKCSNEACQSEIDKQTAKRIKLEKDKESVAQQKLLAKQQEKKDLAAISVENQAKV